jgi:8-oxo-dGTP pyrophosphatase MutT (NUDIX family)
MTCVDVLGLTADGRVAFVSELGQGDDPRVLAFDQGYVVVRPLDAFRDDDGVLQLRFAVQPRGREVRPGQPSRGADAGVDLTALSEVEVRQRVAAYALVTSTQGLLATEFSDRTSVPGRWGMPGGGIEDHEQPTEAVLREVAEETRQDITLGDLVEVQSSHWVGRSPRDTMEDFHAVRLIYEAGCDAPTTPVVVDVGGTTESARWVPLDAWRAVAWTAGWHQILGTRLP